MNRLKIGGLVVGGAIVLMVILPLINRSISPLLNNGFMSKSMPGTSFQKYGDYDEAMEESMAYGETAMDSAGNRVMIAPVPPVTPGTTGEGAEDYEVTEYNTLIHTKNLKEDCQKIANLKTMEEVIFENQYNHRTNCNFTFKVKNEKAEAILAIIESFKPDELSKNTYTIKSTIDRVSNQSEIYENKKKAIEETLQDALKAYDDIANIATRNQDTESLAKIISSKIELIERLSREKINADVQLDRLAQNQAEQLDRLKYTRFQVSIFEDKYIDKTQIKDSWKQAVKDFFRDLNRIIQEVTIGLAVILLAIIQYSLLVLLLVFAAKYVWKCGKAIWIK